MPPTLLEPAADARPTDLGTSLRPRRAVLRRLVRFAVIGIVMTSAYLVLYAALAGALGRQGANVVAWVVTAVADTSANRRLTFAMRGRAGAARAQVEGLLVFATGMLVTSGSLLALDRSTTEPGQVLQLAVLVGANLVAGLLRFWLLQRWVFAPGRLSGRGR